MGARNKIFYFFSTQPCPHFTQTHIPLFPTGHDLRLSNYFLTSGTYLSVLAPLTSPFNFQNHLHAKSTSDYKRKRVGGLRVLNNWRAKVSVSSEWGRSEFAALPTSIAPVIRDGMIQYTDLLTVNEHLNIRRPQN